MSYLGHLNLFAAILTDKVTGNAELGSMLSEKSTLSGSKELLSQLGAKDVLVCGDQAGYLANLYPKAGAVGAIYSVLEYLIPTGKKHRRTKTLKALLIVPEGMSFSQYDSLRQLVHCGGEMHFSLRFDGQSFPLFLPLTEEIRDCARLIAKSDNSSLKRFISCLGCASITRHTADVNRKSEEDQNLQSASRFTC